jgi:hypothetical protein
MIKLVLMTLSETTIFLGGLFNISEFAVMQNRTIIATSCKKLVLSRAEGNLSFRGAAFWRRMPHLSATPSAERDEESDAARSRKSAGPCGIRFLFTDGEASVACPEHAEWVGMTTVKKPLRLNWND